MATSREHREAVYKAMEKVLREAAEIGVPITVKDLAQHKDVIGVAKSEVEVKVKVKNLEHARLLTPKKVDPALGHRGRIGYVWKDASRTYESVFKARSIPGKGKRMPKENKGDTVRLIVFGIVFELDNVNINVTKIGGRTTIHID